MRQQLFLLALLTTSFSFLDAQSRRPLHGDQQPWPPATGTTSFVLTPAPGTEPDSLKRLCDASTLIVDGFVQYIPPVRQLTKVQRLETDVVFRVTRVLKGPATINTIAVTQRGGSVGAYTEQPAQYSLMKQGERYLLFARVDNRPNIPAVPGNARYLITGEWVGNFRVDADSRVHLSSGAASGLRTQYEGATVDQIISAVAELLRP